MTFAEIGRMFELRTLGAANIRRRDATPLNGAVGQRRTLALLAVLAVHGDDGIRRDGLLALLWPDAAPEKGRHALAQSLYHIRRSLGCDDAILASGATVCLNADRIDSDVARFTAFAARGDDANVIATYGGPFLDGFVLPGCVEFDQWMSAQRLRLQGLVARSLLRHADAAEARQDAAAAVVSLERLVALDPLSAVATARLMRATWTAGDRTGAMQIGRTYSTLVREQLDLEPDRVVADLMEEMRATPDGTVAAQMPTPRSVVVASPPVAPVSPEQSVEPTLPPRRRGFGRRLLTAGLVTAAVGAAVVLQRVDRSASAAGLPLAEQSVVVAPFRVTGSDGSLSYLREGMVELLSTRLADDSAARAIDPGRVIGAWHRSDLGAATDNPAAAAIGIAKRLGASRVVVGSVVGNASKLVVTASVIGVSDGRARAQAEVEGPADSVTSLVDRLAVKLVATSAGEGDRLTGRFTPSLAALRDFLEGQAEYRRGDYSAALPAYERALARDSGFALAALHLALAADRLNSAEQHDRALAIAWANRGDLNGRDLAHLVAFAGPRYPAPSLESEQVAAWENAVVSAPDRAEVWYELGERLFRSGGIAGVADAHVRAKFALTRALSLEPRHRSARQLLIMLAARTGDTALLSRIASPKLLADSIGDLSDFLRWRVALVLGDSAELQRVRRAMPKLNDPSLRAIAMSSLNDAVGLDDGERAARLTMQRADQTAGWFDALMEQHTFALNEGRPRAALQLTQLLQEREPGWRAHLRLRVLDALYSEGDRVAAAAAADSLARTADGPLVFDADGRGVQLADICVLEQWRLAHGDTSNTRRAIARLNTGHLPRRMIPVSANQLACARILDAAYAVVTKKRDATARVAVLDSLMLTGPAVSDAGSYSNILVGRLYLQIGNPRAALIAFRRRPYMTGWPRYLSTARREEADIATMLGDSTIARASFGRYLALRRHPEPHLTATIDTVRRRAGSLSR